MQAWSSRTLWIVAAAVPLASPPPAAAADCPVPAEQAWHSAADSLGLLVIEPDRHIVGAAPGNTKTWPLANDLLGAGDNWFPLDIERKTLCGGVDRWSMFEHPFSGPEHDLHAHLMPLPPFTHLLDEAALVAGKLDCPLSCLDWKKACKADCPHLVYSEVTPDGLVRGGDQALVKTSGLGLPKDPADVGAFGSLACVYGPWVREAFHQNIPEIHPSEVIWGASRDGRLRNLLVLRDRSERFEKKERFAWIPGSWWKPWTSAGVVEARVAVLAGSGMPTLTIRPLPPYRAQAPAKKEVLADGGLQLTLVDETGAFSATLEKLCSSAPRDRRAFVVLKTNVDATAFLAATLQLEGGTLPPLPPVPKIARPPVPETAALPTGFLKKDSLRLVDGRLVGTFEYEQPDGKAGSREEPVDLSAVGARAHLDPTAERVERAERKLPNTAVLWGFNPEAPGREWSVAPQLRAELGLFLEMGNADRGATEILVEELARAIDDDARRRALFDADRPFAVYWDELRIKDLETGQEYDQDAARAAGFDVRCFDGELGTAATCFPSHLEAAREPEAKLVRRVGVLSALRIDSSRVAPTQPPATLRILVSGHVTGPSSLNGPLRSFTFEETFLNHGPGRLEDYRLTGPRSWQLDADQLAPGLLDGLTAALLPGNGEALKAALRRDWLHDEDALSRQVQDPVQRPAARVVLDSAARRKARVFLLYARALSRAGTVSDCRHVPACSPAAESSAAEKAKVECARLRELACSYWSVSDSRP
jgi:hypothetical protein